MSQPPGPHGLPGDGYPPRRRRVLPWLLGGGGLVVVTVVILVLVLTKGPDRDTPEGVVQAVAAAYNDEDVDEYVALACAEAKDTAEKVLRVDDDVVPVPVIELDHVRMDGDEEATAFITATYTEVPEELRDRLPEGAVRQGRMGLRMVNGDWCVASYN